MKIKTTNGDRYKGTLISYNDILVLETKLNKKKKGIDYRKD